MQLFSTLLPIRPGMTKDDFIRLAIEWNQSTPHSENKIPNIVWNGERNIRWGDEEMWMAVEEYRNKNIVAIRYEKNKKGVVWDTDYVLNFDEMKLSIRLDRSYTEDAGLFDPYFSTPYFINTLICGEWLLPDNDLPVSSAPLYVMEKHIELLAGIVKRTARYALPVVYVSRRRTGTFPLDLDKLAWRLKGTAHVLAEGKPGLAQRLREACEDQNEYGGAVGVYYPRGAMLGHDGHLRHLDRAYSGWDRELTDMIVRGVMNFTNAQRVDQLYTWMGVRSSLLFDRLVCQREERIAAEAERDRTVIEADMLISSTDEEINEMRKQITALENENEALRGENLGLRGRLEGASGTPVLAYGKEKDFYQDEIRFFLLTALDYARQNSPDNSRRYHVLSDIIAANGGVEAAKTHFRQKEEILKRLFKDYTDMTKPMVQELERLGFSVSDKKGRHYKLVYSGDHRFWTEIAKTPSDWRAGKNDAARLIRLIT